MNREMHYIPLRERRDYCSRPQADLVQDWKLFGLVLFMCLVATFLYQFVPVVGHAQEVTAIKDYPLTNAGTCMRMHDMGMAVEGASMSKVVELCKKNGVQL